MKVLVCGDRYWSDSSAIRLRLQKLTADSLVITGGCVGADCIAQSIAEEIGLDTVIYPANWVRYGKPAGHIRNKRMLDEWPDLVIAFHDNLVESKGTKNCVEQANKRNILVEVIHSSRSATRG